MFADCFGAPFPVAALNIGGVGDWFEVVGIDAVAYAACVVEFKTGRDGAVNVLVGKTVG